MKTIIIFILALFISLPLSSRAETKKICLNMIVKNESSVICRCLNSVKPLIHHWVIIDTGSSDNTKELIQECLKDIPGELHERAWVNFEENRNQALELARGKADYILFIDADEILQFSSDFHLPDLEKDFYYIMSDYRGTQYARVGLISNQLETRWNGVLHEALDLSKGKGEVLVGVRNIVYTDGARAKDPERAQKDIAILKAAIEKEPDNLRYIFYLAQTYRDIGNYDDALYYYHLRIVKGKGMDEEVYCSFMQIGMINEILKNPKETIIDNYFKAYLLKPTRAEPLFHLASYYRKEGDYYSGYLAARQGLMISFPNDLLFIEKWVYDYGHFQGSLYPEVNTR